jgi:hypothetical protein
LSKTILAPDWGADGELETLQAVRLQSPEQNPRLRSYLLSFDEQLGCDVIVINGRPRSLPGSLEDVPMEYISILQNNTPYRGLHDGWYKEDVEVPGTDGQRFTAQVETYYRGSVLQHSIRVTVSSDDIVGVNKWFDALLRGEKNEFCDMPAPLPDQQPGQVLQQLERAHEYYMRTRRAASREQLIAFCEGLFTVLPTIPGFDESAGEIIILDGGSVDLSSLRAAIELLEQLAETQLDESQQSRVRRIKRFIKDAVE